MGDRQKADQMHWFTESTSPGDTRRHGADPGYAIPVNEKPSKPGFNATMPRFNYVKEHITRAEIPGPGTYDRKKTQDQGQRHSPEKLFSDQSAVFKDATQKEDYAYMRNDKRKPIFGPN